MVLESCLLQIVGVIFGVKRKSQSICTNSATSSEMETKLKSKKIIVFVELCQSLTHSCFLGLVL